MAYESFALVYDRLMAEMPYDHWLEFLQQCLADGDYRTLVDLGCGTGNLALPLAAQGYRVIGVDNAPEMLAIAEQKKMNIQSGDSRTVSTLQFVECDMCDFETPEPVDAVYSFCDSINYVTDEANIQRLFANVRNALRAGGLFVFDVHTDAKFAEYAKSQPFVLNDDDLAYIWTCDYEAPVIHHELTIFVARDDERGSFARIDEFHVQRAYDLDWLRDELLIAGFVDVQCYADFTFEAADECTGRAFVVARAAL
jgi:SAM-dependent methyltransferase